MAQRLAELETPVSVEADFRFLLTIKYAVAQLEKVSQSENLLRGIRGDLIAGLGYRAPPRTTTKELAAQLISFKKNGGADGTGNIPRTA